MQYNTNNSNINSSPQNNKYISRKRGKYDTDNALLNGLIHQLIPYADYAVSQLMQYTTNNFNNFNKNSVNRSINNNQKFNNKIFNNDKPEIIKNLSIMEVELEQDKKVDSEYEFDYKSFTNMYSINDNTISISNNNSNQFSTPIKQPPPPPPKKNLFNTPSSTPTSSPIKPERPPGIMYYNNYSSVSSSPVNQVL